MLPALQAVDSRAVSTALQYVLKGKTDEELALALRVAGPTQWKRPMQSPRGMDAAMEPLEGQQQARVKCPFAPLGSARNQRELRRVESVPRSRGLLVGHQRPRDEGSPVPRRGRPPQAATQRRIERGREPPPAAPAVAEAAGQVVPAGAGAGLSPWSGRERPAEAEAQREFGSVLESLSVQERNIVSFLARRQQAREFPLRVPEAIDEPDCPPPPPAPARVTGPPAHAPRVQTTAAVEQRSPRKVPACRPLPVHTPTGLPWPYNFASKQDKKRRLKAVEAGPKQQPPPALEEAATVQHPFPVRQIPWHGGNPPATKSAPADDEPARGSAAPEDGTAAASVKVAVRQRGQRLSVRRPQSASLGMGKQPQLSTRQQAPT
eukprot:TRINITY_DN36261_c0_g1_i1.p1 TRINITY_DN36261_c0_g1~~TRINITY_DN36261_c0_g1_i1.p1  ORF type:complete len:410 (+),score=101.17 TRINITY_DN36261_c0_g1_i1:101-1231(+)